MGNRLSKIYTRTGDMGTTSLGNGDRIAKNSQRMVVIGDVDELNSVIGMILVHPIADDIRHLLTEVQHKLFDLGGELSIPGYELVQATDVEYLEKQLDAFNDHLPPLKDFILPGGGPAAAVCHLARTVCRRAERQAVSLEQTENCNHQALVYLNRLSDLLFVLGRVLARQEGGSEVLWRKKR